MYTPTDWLIKKVPWAVWLILNREGLIHATYTQVIHCIFEN